MANSVASLKTPVRKRRKSDLEPDPEIWAILKGGVLRKVLTDFYGRVYEDKDLKPHFDGVPISRAIDKQCAFMRQIFTGEKLYFGDRPRNAHHAMVISEELFDYREELLSATLRDHGIAENFVQRWRDVDNCFRKQIVKAKPFGKKVNGVEQPLEGFEEVVLEFGAVCDSCHGEVDVGTKVVFHIRTGETYCPNCIPKSYIEGGAGAVEEKQKVAVVTPKPVPRKPSRPKLADDGKWAQRLLALGYVRWVSLTDGAGDLLRLQGAETAEFDSRALALLAASIEVHGVGLGRGMPKSSILNFEGGILLLSHLEGGNLLAVLAESKGNLGMLNREVSALATTLGQGA